MIKVPIPVSRMVSPAQLNVAIIIGSSPIRLIDGGRARLVRFARSHHRPKRGRMVCIPRAKSMVRLWVRS